MAIAVVLSAISQPIAAADFVDEVIVGHSLDLDSREAAARYRIPQSELFNNIVGIGIAGSNDHVYAWFDDGTRIAGSSGDLDRYEAPQSYALPPGKSPSDIVGMAIAGSNDRVYTWFKDGTRSVGNSRDLDAHEAPANFQLPPGKNTGDILGIGIAGSDDRVYAWYVDGTRSIGNSRDLDAYEPSRAYSLPAGMRRADIVGIAIAGSNDHVYTWSRRWDSSCCGASAKFNDAVVDFLHANRIPGLSVAVSKNQNLLFEKGFGYSDLPERRSMGVDHGIRSGSTAKVFTAVALMMEKEKSKAWRFNDVVGVAIAGSNDHTYAWSKSGEVTVGHSRNLDYHEWPRRYSLPPGIEARTIVGIGIAGSNDHVYAWFKDGTRSVGSSLNLDRYEAPQPYALPPGKTPSDIIGMAIAGSNDRVYTWFRNGTRSVGNSRDLDAYEAPASFLLPPGKNPGDILGIGIAGSDDRVYAWYDDGTRSVGNSRDLDAHKEPENYSLPPALGFETLLYGPSGVLKDPTYLQAVADSDHADQLDWFKEIRIKHLLSHTAGFQGGGSISGAARMFNIPESQVTYRQIHLHKLAASPLAYRPGTSSDYSNHGMGLVGHLVAAVSGIDFNSYMRKELLDQPRLKLSNIVEYGTETNLGIYSQIHFYDGSTIRTRAVAGPAGPKLAAGGLVYSCGDAVRFMLAIDGFPTQPDILNTATINRMAEPFLPNISRHSIAWSVNKRSDGSTKISHGGDTADGNAYMLRFLPGYHDANGEDLGDINVCVGSNIDVDGGSGKLGQLANTLARLAAE